MFHVILAVADPAVSAALNPSATRLGLNLFIIYLLDVCAVVLKFQSLMLAAPACHTNKHRACQNLEYELNYLFLIRIAFFARSGATHLAAKM
jgi:hypothetical protein